MSHCWTTDRSVRARLALFAATHRPSTMKQLQLPIITSTIASPAEFIGLTDWVQASVETPPVVGWWVCRRTGRPSQKLHRRWWNAKWFSQAVFPDDDDADTEWAKGRPSRAPLGEIEWCGLKQPHPDRYPYRLFTFGEKL